MNTQPTTLAQQFAAEYAKGVVPAMIKALKNGKTRTMLLLVAVMLVTYWHVASFLAADPAFGLFGYAIPVIIDGAMIQMLDILQTRGMRKPAKRAAMGFAVVLGGVSGFLNWTAAETTRSAFVFASLVVVAIATKVIVSLMGPDFAAMEQVEQAVTTTAAPVDEAAAARRSEIARKAAETRRQNAAEAARKADEAKARRRAQRVQPVSPATVAEIESAYAPSAYL